MADSPLIVFGTSGGAAPLAVMRDALAVEGAPASLGVDIAGEATEAQLQDPSWEAAIVRWTEPELHEVLLIERLPGDDEEAKRIVAAHREKIGAHDDEAGRMIVADTLSRVRTVYTVQLLPALIAADGHEAWGALDALLRSVAREA